ncbi:MAG: hypothetical protein P8L85_04320 [Rubripirellula sp.]|nr:hypothetical protein [Rubripirellula sp.]
MRNGRNSQGCNSQGCNSGCNAGCNSELAGSTSGIVAPNIGPANEFPLATRSTTLPLGKQKWKLKVEGDDFSLVHTTTLVMSRISLNQRLAGKQCATEILFITEQTIAGAISTGTHGSGRHSLSHYVSGVRIAKCDDSIGEAVIEEITSGDALLVARCSLGCLGITLAVTIEHR